MRSRHYFVYLALGILIPMFPSDVLISQQSLSFSDITLSAGTGGPEANKKTGGHAAIFADVNGDGRPDLYITMLFKSPMPDLFFRNRGNNKFASEAAARGINDEDGGSHGATFADLDNDGDFDLLNGTTYGTTSISGRNNLFRNDGNGYFTEVSEASGLPERDWPTRGIIAFDMDRDGDLDVFGVTNYQGSDDPPDERNEIYRNDGNLRFTTITSGDLYRAPVGQGATDTDYDGDGDIDIIAGNRTGDVNILRNDGKGNFTLVPPVSLGIQDRAGDGVSTADIDNDGDLDMLLVGSSTGNLYRNNGDGTFQFLRTFSNIDGYMGGFADLDHDRDVDLVFAGYKNCFLNDGSGRFSEGPSVPIGGIDDPRSVAFADIDDDGDLDFAFGVKRSRNWLVRNNIDAGNWLKIKLVSPSGQAGAFGAKTRIYPPGKLDGKLLGLRESRSNTGYLGQDDPVVHFGLGEYSRVDVEVTFLDGTTVTRTDVTGNQTIVIDAREVVVERFEQLELVLNATKTYGTPYREASLSARFVGPKGSKSLPGFWDGGNIWKVRFSPDEVGQWSYATSSKDAGLTTSGTFRCVPSVRKGGIQARLQTPLHFQHQDGTPFWWFGETAWAAFRSDAAENLNSQTFRHYIDRRAEQGFNYVHGNLLAGPNEGGNPFSSPVVGDEVNPEFWQEVDRRVQHMNDSGITAGLMLAWKSDKKGAGSSSPVMDFDWTDFPDQQARLRYCEYVAARYSAYNVVWILSGEYNEAPDKQPNSKALWSDLAYRLKENDPHGRMMAIHGQSKVETFADEGWMDFGDYMQLYSNLNSAIIEARDHAKPVVNAEYGYFLRDKLGDGQVTKANSASIEEFRHASWDIAMAGGYSVGGFGTTYLGGKREHGPFDVDAPKNAPAETQIPLMKDFFSSLEWWNLQAANDLMSGSGTLYCLMDFAGTYVAYVRGTSSNVEVQVGDGTPTQYAVQRFDPRTGARMGLPIQTTSTTLKLNAPDKDDWVFLIRADGSPPLVPLVSSFQPKSGSIGAEITITGESFFEVATVTFNGVAAAFNVVSDSEIRTTVPPGASTGRLMLSNSAGSTATSTNFIVIPAGPTDSPIHVYLTWQSNTSNTMTINYQTLGTTNQSSVYYDTLPRHGEVSSYAFHSNGDPHKIEGLDTYSERTVHAVELTDLIPGQTYYFVAGDPETGISEEKKFRTIPDNEALRFVTGGDMSTSAEVPALLMHAAKQDPMFALIGGDIAYAHGQLENWSKWDTWIVNWESFMITPDGYSVPLVMAIGNHEVYVDEAEFEPSRTAPFYFGYFAQADTSYFTMQFGSNTVLFVLDSGHIASHAGPQAEWLADEMAKFEATPNKMAIYHVPMYPGHRSFDEVLSEAARTNWLPIFDDYSLTVGFENHDHVMKRTKLLKANQPNDSGTLYIGDGCFGQVPRSLDQAGAFYLDRLEKKRHFWLVEVPHSTDDAASAMIFTAIDEQGLMFDTYELPKKLSVSIIEPIDHTDFNRGNDIQLRATAMYRGGRVARVAFFHRGTKIGEAFTAPYEVTWFNAPLGDLEVTALATGTDGSSEWSDPIRVTVYPPGYVKKVRTFVPTNDSFIWSKKPAKIYGAFPNLRVRRTDSADQFSYMKFDVQGISGVITSARLRLTAIDGSDEAGSVHQIANSYAGSQKPWEEGELTWQNAPKITTAAISAWGAVSSNDLIEYDLGDAITSNGPYSFAIQTRSSDTVQFDSKEGANPPELVVEFVSDEKPEPAPSIISFTPTSGQSGSSVTLFGENLSSVTEVTFGGEPTPTFDVTSETQLVAEVPGSAVTGKIKVAGSHGTAESTTDFTVEFAPSPLPVIGNFIPESGGVASLITISGLHFNEVSAIEFNGVSATEFSVPFETEIIAEVPVNATSGPIRVITAAGVDSSASDFRVLEPNVHGSISLLPLADTYVRSDKTSRNYGDSEQLRVKKSSSLQRTYFKFDLSALSAPPITAILKIRVSNGSDHAGTIHSVTNSYNHSSELWTERNLTWENAPEITTPATSAWDAAVEGDVIEFDLSSAIAGSGVYSFAIQNQSSNTVKFDSKESLNPPELILTFDSAVEPAPLLPNITSFSPTSGTSGSSVSISGDNLESASEVSFGGVSTSQIDFKSATQLVVAVPQNAQTGPIKVTTTHGTTESEAHFAIESPSAAPVISHFTPQSGAIGSQVTIEGLNFNKISAIEFNGVATSEFSVVSDTEIVATVPDEATSGPIHVRSEAESGKSKDDFSVLASENPPGPRTLSFQPSDDSFVWSKKPSNNYHAFTSLRVRRTSSADQIAYLKFQLQSIDGHVTKATLRLYVTEGGNDGGAVQRVSNSYDGSNTPWREAGLQWPNAPRLEGDPLFMTGPAQAEEFVEFDVTGSITGNGPHSYAVRNGSRDAVLYSSKEGAISPELIIEVSAPNTAAKLGLASGQRATRPSQGAAIPERVVLSANYPNPFNLETTIQYGLPSETHVRLEIYNIQGQRIRTLVDAVQSAGLKRITWNGRNDIGLEVSSALYFATLRTEQIILTEKLLLQK